MKIGSVGRVVAAMAVSGLMAGTLSTGASAAPGKHYYAQGHGYGAHRHYRHYGYGPGPAIAGAALGIVGLATGAAAAGSYGYAPSYGYGPGYGYAPSYGYAPDYGYAPNGYDQPY